MSEKITLEIEFDVGGLREIGIGGYKTGWISAERDGTEYELTTGAGVGNPCLEASARKDGHGIYAKADIRGLTQKLWDAMTSRLEAASDVKF